MRSCSTASLYNPLFNFMWTLNQLLPYAKRRGKTVRLSSMSGPDR